MKKNIPRRSFLKTSLLLLSSIGLGSGIFRTLKHLSETGDNSIREVDVVVHFVRTLPSSGQIESAKKNLVLPDRSSFFYEIEHNLIVAFRQHFAKYENLGVVACVKQEIKENRFLRVTRWKSLEEFNHYHQDPIIRNLAQDAEKLGYVFSYSIVKV